MRSRRSIELVASIGCGFRFETDPVTTTSDLERCCCVVDRPGLSLGQFPEGPSCPSRRRKEVNPMNRIRNRTATLLLALAPVAIAIATAAPRISY